MPVPDAAIPFLARRGHKGGLLAGNVRLRHAGILAGGTRLRRTRRHGGQGLDILPLPSTLWAIVSILYEGSGRAFERNSL